MSIIKATGLAYVAFTAPDLDQAASFLADFGFRSSARHGGALFSTGYGAAPFLHQVTQGEPGFAALGITAGSMDDLNTLSAATGVAVAPLDAPGGGWCVHLTDPDGFALHVVSGQEQVAGADAFHGQTWNRKGDRGRVSVLKRLADGPAHVHRLGHCVLGVRDFRRSEAWYKAHFGLLTSDEIEVAPGQAMGAFLRCDLGELPTDHHSVFLAQAANAPAYRHAAFEVYDLDDLMAGHDYLLRKSHKNLWGVGRHVLGSQVFDYWTDPWGHQMELWTDGDLLTRSDGSRVAPVAELRKVQWGATMPAS